MPEPTDAATFSSHESIKHKTYLGVLIDRQVDITLSDHTATGELSQRSSDSLVDIIGEGWRQLNILAVENQVDVVGRFRRHGECRRRLSREQVVPLNGKGRCHKGR